MSVEIKDIFKCLKKYAYLTPDAIDDLYYLEGTIEDLEQKVEQLENIRKEAIEYMTSYKSIETIQQCEHSENNKNLDEKTMIEMIRRYLIVHDYLLNILSKGE